MQPADIARIITVATPALSPDGRYVAYVVRRADADANRYRSAVWVACTDGSRPPWQLTAGTESDSSPVWSPTGDRVAFTSSRGTDDDRKVTLHVIAVDRAGETVTLTTRDEGISGLAWSPDGRRLAFASRVRDARYSDGDDERANPPRRIDRLFARLDSEGWTIDRPVQLFVVPVDGSATPRRVTNDAYDYDAPAWSPDSSRLAVTSAQHEDFDLEGDNDVWIVDVDVAGEAPSDETGAREFARRRQLTATDAWYSNVSWDPAGERLAVLRIAGKIGYRHARLATVDVESGRIDVRTTDLDRTCAPYPGVRPPAWVGERVYFAVESRGTTEVLSASASGDPDLHTVVDGRRIVTGYDVASGASESAEDDATVVAFTATDSAGPSELYVLRHGTETKLTSHQEAFVAACPPLATQRFAVTSPSGMELDAWVVLPPDFDADTPARYPALLNIHGGPHTQYGEGWFDEFQMYASAGYVVIYSNPRGSTGYGEASARVLLSAASSEDPGEGWGAPAFDDLMAVVDEALARYPAIDRDRLGVMGGSYGGYMTSWIIGHTTRFAAACSERAVNNVASLEWSSDAGGEFRWAMGVSHLDAPEEYARLSPVTYVADVETPVMILHSENDLRCPTEQADALWVALRLLRKEVEYYRFPAESHELTRGGSPVHRRQRAALLLDWFGRKIGPDRPNVSGRSDPATDVSGHDRARMVARGGEYSLRSRRQHGTTEHA